MRDALRGFTRRKLRYKTWLNIRRKPTPSTADFLRENRSFKMAYGRLLRGTRVRSFFAEFRRSNVLGKQSGEIRPPAGPRPKSCSSKSARSCPRRPVRFEPRVRLMLCMASRPLQVENFRYTDATPGSS